jgi:hypothetical protein
MIALSGSQTKAGNQKVSPQSAPSKLIRPKRTVISQDTPIQPASPVQKYPEASPQSDVKKTVIIRKRTHAPEPPVPIEKEPQPMTEVTEDSYILKPEGDPVAVKDPAYRAKDEVFLGKGVRGSPVPKARDATLIHTSLKQKKPIRPPGPDSSKSEVPGTEDSSPTGQQGKKTKKQDELSWN